MQEIKRVLEVPIREGYLNWDKLEAKISAAIGFLLDGKEKPFKFEDAIEVPCVAPLAKGKPAKVKWSYKLLQPRLKNGKYYCSGFVLGRYLTENSSSPTYFPATVRRF